MLFAEPIFTDLLMLRRLLSYLLLGSLPFLLNTCSLGCQECKDLRFTPQLREYFLDFKEGSYWIYRNVQNGDLDSVYFVSQNVSPEAVPKGGPVCYQEYGVVRFKGFADKPFGYVVMSWNNEMKINSSSEIAFVSSYQLNQVDSKLIGGSTYNQVITLSNCCFDGCNNGCEKTYFRFLKLYFAPRVGLIRWEVENRPQYGNAVYELVRYNAVR